jgi:hypothetical protein
MGSMVEAFIGHGVGEEILGDELDATVCGKRVCTAL